MFRSQGKIYIKKKERPKAGLGEIENPFAACRQRCPYICAAQAPFLLWASYTIFALSLCPLPFCPFSAFFSFRLRQGRNNAVFEHPIGDTD